MIVFIFKVHSFKVTLMWSACGLFRNKPNITVLLLLLLLLLLLSSLQRSYNCTTDTAKLHCLLLLLNKSIPATLTTVLPLLNPYNWLGTGRNKHTHGMLEKHSKSIGEIYKHEICKLWAFSQHPSQVRGIIALVIKTAIKRFGLNITI